ncbi:hypothetical protein GOTRE_037_00400 [Gordonia terrae NBRC 100016]|uniref:Hydrolase n=1 Tax=Gordonia terrae NBRC 100016 TaxID=1089454 RepID=A0ABQ0HAZ7_9ACTN|nr:hypothetical protein GOTRE_037_00400 [Gordonia terrae NBRC 100016]
MGEKPFVATVSEAVVVPAELLVMLDLQECRTQTGPSVDAFHARSAHGYLSNTQITWIDTETV